MKLALLGVGNAGTRIVDQLCAVEKRADRPLTNGQVVAFNTTPSAFAETDHIDDERQVVIGDIHPDVVQPDEIVDSDSDGSSEDEAKDTESADTTETAQPEASRREGVAGDPELGVEVARDDLPEIRRALDMVDDTEVDAAMIVAGLGGGTGCGLGAVLLEELQAIYEIPVYVLGALPSDEESDERALTAARAIRTFVPRADSVIPVDNTSWVGIHGDSDNYRTLNEALATRIISVFGAGEHESQSNSELQIDPNDVRRVLDIGGLATVGYAQTELTVPADSWLTRLRRLLGMAVDEPEPQSDAVSIKALVQRAVESELTLPCDIETADRVLLVLSGPPEELSRKGFESGRYLLEDETGTVEVLAGDEPLPEATRVTATILLSNVTGVPRIESIQKRAVAFQRARKAQSTTDESVDKAEQSTDNNEDRDGHGFDFRDDGVVDQPEDETVDDQSSDKDDSAAAADKPASEAGNSAADTDEPVSGEDDTTSETDKPEAESKPQEQQQ